MPELMHHSGWPWPLDAVQDWFEGLWDQVYSWFKSVADWVWQALPAPIRDFLGWIGKLAGDAAAAIYNGLTGFLSWLGEAGRAFWDGLLAFVRDPVGTLKAAWDSLTAGFTQLIGWWDPAQSRFVGGFLGWLWDTFAGIWATLTDIAGKVGVTLVDVGTGVINTIGGVISQVWGAMQSVGSWLSQTIWGWFDGTARWLTDSFRWLQVVVTDAADWIVTRLEEFWANTTAQLGPILTEAVRPWMQAVGNFFQAALEWLWSAAKTLAQVCAGLASGVRDAITGVLQPAASSILTSLTIAVGPHSLPSDVQEAAAEFTTAYMKRIRDLTNIPTHSLPALSELVSRAGQVVILNVGASLIGELAGLALDQAHPLKNIGFRDLAMDLISSFQLPAVIGPMLSSPVYASIIRPMMYRYNELSPTALPPIPDATRMLWRGVVTETQYIELLHMNAYANDWEKGYVELARNIPGPGDLITFVVREVITPEEFTVNMAKQGFDEFWSAAYWEAHWVLPSPGALYDAYHREIITAEQLDAYIVLHDFKPEARREGWISDQDIQRKLIKTLIPRVDLRRGWELGSLTDEQLVQRFEWLGYEEDSELMAEIAKREALDAEVGKVRDNLKADYVAGFITAQDLEAGLVALGEGPGRVLYHVRDALDDRDRDYKKDMLDYYKDGYKKDLITEEDFRARVMEIIVQPEVADLYVEKAYVDKYKKVKPKQEVDAEKAAAEAQKLRVSLAVEQYRKYAIEKPGLLTALVAAGLDPAVASARADYEEAKRPFEKPTPEEQLRLKEQARIQKLGEQAAVERFRAGLVDAAGLVQELRAIGYSEALATAITQLEVFRGLG